MAARGGSSYGRRPGAALIDPTARPHPARLSVVIPCLDEAAVLSTTVQRLRDCLGPREGLELELVLVDDGSRDGTDGVIRRLSDGDPGIVGVFLARSFGQQAATSAGLRFASGDAVAVMDADLQDPPEVLLAMLDAWQAGADVAYGTRRTREGEPVVKTLLASAYYRVLARLSEVDVPLDTGDFRLMDRSVVDALCAMPEQDRFLRGMVAWLGFSQVPVPFDRAPRAAGHSKYDLARSASLAIDGLVALAPAPLRAFVAVGAFGVAVGAIGAVAAAWQGSWALAAFASVWLLGGVQIALLAVVGEYVARALREVRRRPPYVVREVVGPSVAGAKVRPGGWGHDTPVPTVVSARS